MIRIRVMTDRDLPVMQRLKQQAGWNQTDADLRRYLQLQPDGCFIAERDGQPVGTTTTCIFGPVAWIAMVLVDQSLRRQGIGAALMKHAMEFLETQGVRSMRLDATPLGQPVYEKLGFHGEYQLARYEGVLPHGEAVPGVASIGADDLEAIVKLDRAVTGTNRGKMLHALYAENPTAMRVVRREGRLAGFVTMRPGSRAMQIGPCLASADAGPLLLADACHRYAGQAVFIDVPIAHAAATAFAERKGLRVQRHLLRMARGEPVIERIAEMWASSGPEKG